MQRSRCFRGLTSGSARWLMSRASSHVAAAGLRLSGERSHAVQGLDTCQHRTLTYAGVPLSRDLAVVRTLLGGTWGPSEGPSMPSWVSRTVIEGPGCVYRGLVFLHGGPDPMIHSGVYHLPLPRGAPRPVHMVGSGAVLHAARRRHACKASLYYSRGYP
jgi:hypothetical protein